MVKFRKSLALLLSLTLVVTFALSGIALPVSADTTTEEPIDLLNGIGSFDEGTNWQQTIFADAGTSEAAIVADPTGAAGNTVLRLGTETEGSHTLAAYLKMAKLWNPETETYTARLQAGKSYTLTLDVYGAAARLYFEPAAAVMTSGGAVGWNTMSGADGWTTYKFVFYAKDNVADTENGGYHADWWSWAFNLVKSSNHGSIADYTYIDNVTLKETVADSIELDTTSATLEPGEKLTLAATLGPDRSIQQPVVFSSNADAVATVDAETGVVTAVADGTATITATSGDLTATCTVKVKTYGVMDMSAFHYSAAITNGNGQAVAAGDPVPSYTDPDGTEYLWVEPGNNDYTKLAKATLPKVNAGEWIAITFKARVHNAGADNAGGLRAYTYFTDFSSNSAGRQQDFRLQGANTDWVWVTRYMQASQDRTAATIGFQIDGTSGDATAKKQGYDVADLRIWKVSPDEMNLFGYASDFEQDGIPYGWGSYTGSGLITGSGEFVKESDGNTAFHFTSGTGTKYFMSAPVTGSGNTTLGVRKGVKLKLSWRQKGGTVSFAPTSNFAGTTRFVVGTPTTASTDWETVTVYVDATNATSYNGNYALGFTFGSGVYIDDLEMYEVTDATAIDLVVNAEMGKDVTQTATIATTKKHAYINGLTFSSDNTAVATVDAATGVITGVSYGTANITATVTVGSEQFTSTKAIEVKKPVATGLKLDTTTATLTVGGTVTLTPSATPDGADAPASYTWESSDPTVATVVDGVVTTKKAGEATITVSAEGLTSATCVVTVIEPGDFFNGLGSFDVADGAYSSSALNNIYANGTIVADPAGGDNKVLMIPNQTNVDAGTYTYSTYFKWNKMYDILTGKYNKKIEVGKAYTLTFKVYGEAVAMYFSGTKVVAQNAVKDNTIWHQFGDGSKEWKEYSVTFYVTSDSFNAEWANSVAKGGNGASYSSTTGPTYIDDLRIVEAKASEITLDQTEGTLALGTTTTLTPTFGPANTRVPSELVWESDDEDVAIVENGVVKAVGKGQAVISVTADGITTPATFTVTVKGPPATAITLNKTEVNLEAGGTETLTVSGVPADSEVPTITWESDNTKVAKVVDGVITAVAPGTATITVTAEGLAPVTCTVNVAWPTEQFPNGDMDTSLDGLSFQQKAGQTTGTGWEFGAAGVGVDGSNGLKLTTTGAKYFYKTYMMRPNSLYVFSYVARAEGTTGKLEVNLVSGNCPGVAKYDATTRDLNGKWTMHYMYLRTGDTVSMNAAYNIYFDVRGLGTDGAVYVDNISLKLLEEKDNILPNPEFNFEDENWDGASKVGVEQDPADPTNKALAVYNTWNGSYDITNGLPYMDSYAMYTLTFDSKVDEQWLADGSSMNFYIGEDTVTDGVVTVTRRGDMVFYNTATIKQTTEWQPNTVVIFSNSRTNLNSNTFHFNVSGGTGTGKLYIDNLKLQRVDDGRSVHGTIANGYKNYVSIDGVTWYDYIQDVEPGTVVYIRPTEHGGQYKVLSKLTARNADGTVNVLNKDIVNGYTAENFGTGDGRNYQYVMGEKGVRFEAALRDASSTSFKLDTVGTALRYTEDDTFDGIRFLTRLQLKKDSFDADAGVITVLYNGVEYTVAEMGSVLARTGEYDGELTLDNAKWQSQAYVKGGNMSLIDYTTSYVDFTVVMKKGANVDQAVFEAREYAARGYLILEDANGDQITVYSDSTQIDSVDSVQARL